MLGHEMQQEAIWPEALAGALDTRAHSTQLHTLSTYNTVFTEDSKAVLSDRSRKHKQKYSCREQQVREALPPLHGGEGYGRQEIRRLSFL